MPMSGGVLNLIQLIRSVHRDNSTLVHFAQDPDARIRSTMYLTPFVYQFFIYNSLYSVDWTASFSTGQLTHQGTSAEDRAQRSYEEFLEHVTRAFPGCLNQAFAELEALDLDGAWTCVVPDPMITEDMGRKFFGDLRRFQGALRSLRRSGSRDNHSVVFECIRELRPFVYRVRCNVFHGRKSLVEALEADQNDRIKVYYHFLKGIVGAFFLAFDEADGDFSTMLGGNAGR
jgi:hypothetical protein